MRPPGAAILALAASITAGEPYRDPLHSLASWRSWNDFQGWHAAKGLEAPIHEKRLRAANK